MDAPVCQYCGSVSVLVGGETIYPHRSDLYDKLFWSCLPCVAYVGCYPDSTKPMGELANKELRRARGRVHRVFDVIWKQGHKTRTDAYSWLANQLHLSLAKCHIGMFDLDTCSRAWKFCRKYHYAKGIVY
jgi:hypothetical protein